jgi:hypothetical protein
MEQNNKNANKTTLTSNTKNLIIAGIAIVVVIAAAIIIPHLKKANAPTAAPTDSMMTTTEATTPSTPKTDETAWNAALKEYTGRVVLFQADCSASPATQTHPLGTKILLVNDSAVPHVVIAGVAGSTIGAYHYKTFTIGTSDKLIISCDNNKDAATILVK